MATLILVRHAKSEWNALGLWTGWQDVSLSDEGRRQAIETAEQIRNIPIHAALSSNLKRTKETLAIILDELGSDVPPRADPAFNERNYGVFTGKNKWEVKKELGEEAFMALRRDWDHPIPDGESLKDVYERVVPRFSQEVLPILIDGKNTIIVSHGNTLRALVKNLESISDEDISDVEIGVGEAYVYKLDNKGNIVSKQICAENTERGKI